MAGLLVRFQPCGGLHILPDFGKMHVGLCVRFIEDGAHTIIESGASAPRKRIATSPARQVSRGGALSFQ